MLSLGSPTSSPHSVRSVSYTHLDVYKRQDIHSVLRDVVASYYGDFQQKKCVPHIVIPNSPAIIWGDPDALSIIHISSHLNDIMNLEQEDHPSAKEFATEKYSEVDKPFQLLSLIHIYRIEL